MNSPQTFRWLHLSDIHVGMGGQAPLWPRFETILLEDLETACRKTGGLDLVIFSGDLAQIGAVAEFNAFDEIMDRILNRLGQLGSHTKIVTTPGNHDLGRPAPLRPETVALTQFWQNQDLRDGFWKDGNDAYRSFTSEVFVNFTDWQRRSIDRGVHLSPQRVGPLPGDASYVVETAAGRVGLVVLNSAWLQLGGGDYLGQLHVDVKQMLAVTDERPDDWVRQNVANLLVTHHPPQ